MLRELAKGINVQLVRSFAAAMNVEHTVLHTTRKQQGQVVTEIQYGEDEEDLRMGGKSKPAKVFTAGQTYEAEIVLVTIPLGLLKEKYAPLIPLSAFSLFDLLMGPVLLRQAAAVRSSPAVMEATGGRAVGLWQPQQGGPAIPVRLLGRYGGLLRLCSREKRRQVPTHTTMSLALCFEFAYTSLSILP